MKRKLILTVLAGICFAALFTCAASAESWLDRASADSPVYPQETPYEKGDLDGSGALGPADARIALRISVRLEKKSAAHNISADMDGDGKITPADARQILRYSVGLDGYTPPRGDDGVYQICVWAPSATNEHYQGEPNLITDNGIGALEPLTINTVQPEDDLTEKMPLWRLRCVEDAERFLDAWEKTDLESGTPYVHLPLSVFLRRYDSAFFETRELFLCLKHVDNACSHQTVYPPVEENGALTIPVGDATANVLKEWTDSYYFLILPLPKETVRGYTAFDTKSAGHLLLTWEEDSAANSSRHLTRWEFACEHLLTRDAFSAQYTGSVYYAALENTRNSGFRWACEADCEIREYRPGELNAGRDDAGNYIYVREEIVAAPGNTDKFLQYFIIAAPFPGDYALRFRQAPSGISSATEPDATEEIDACYTVSLSVKNTEPTVTETVRLATENGAVATSSQAPFNLNNTILGRSSLMGIYNNCRFRGVIEAVDRYTVSWKTGDGKESGPYPRAILKVRVLQNYSGLPGRDHINILYVYDMEDGPIGIETGREYVFLDCRLLDDDYYRKAAAVLPDYVEKDETLRMADVVAGPAKYTFLPIDGENCTAYRGYFAEEQLNMKGNPPEVPWYLSIPGLDDYVTVQLEAMEDYLINLESRQDDMIY